MSRMKNQSSHKGKTGWFDWLLLAIFLGGFAVYIYPSISNLWNTWRQSQLTVSYEQAVEQLDEEDYSALFQEAEEYNQRHAQEIAYNPEGPLKESDEQYFRHLNTGNSHIMAVLEIPSIDSRLNVFYGTDDEELQEGAGHLRGTSLPIGGESTHSVIVAHAGLPNAQLFTRLDELEEGDQFLIRVLDRTLAYEVDQIKIVLPSQSEDLAVVPQEDYVTLLTCTPYGVNTHRLLVRGKRIELSDEEKEEISRNTGWSILSPYKLAAAAGIVLLILLLIFWLIYKHKKSKRNNQGGIDEKNH